MSKQYAVAISRYDEDDNQQELVDIYISADDAIDLMLHINENIKPVNDEIEDDEETGEETEEEAEPEKEPEPKKTKTQNYDIDQVVADLKADDKPGEIAKRYGVSTRTVYNIKYRFKDEIAGTKPKKAELTEEDRITNMAKEGTSLVELQMAFPNTPAWKLRDIHARFN